MEERETLFSIADIPLNFPTSIKPLSKQEKTWILQRSIFSMVEAEDMRQTNLPRYRAFLKDNKLRHNETNRDKWLKTKDAKYKKIEKLTKASFGFFTNKLTEQGLFEVESECRDRVNRNQSPTIYILSLRKGYPHLRK